MPEISRFYGMVIEMYFDDHPPPHFHVRCGRQEISVDIDDGTVQGSFPAGKLKLIQQWRTLHKDELILNWWLTSQRMLPRYIEPLE